MDGIQEYFAVDRPLLAEHGAERSDSLSTTSPDPHAAKRGGSIDLIRDYVTTKKLHAHALINDAVGLIKRGLPLGVDEDDFAHVEEIRDSDLRALFTPTRSFAPKNRIRDQGHFIIAQVLAKQSRRN